MSRFWSIAIALLSLAVLLFVISRVPLILSVTILFLWTFVSIGELVVDGYMRLLAGSVLALYAGWRVIVLLPVYFGQSDLVPYAQYMMEAQFWVVVVYFAGAVGLVYAGVRSLRKSNTPQVPTE